ncbi:MAG: SurA N-terminal domain-containing protein [Magnetococcales bacterium]|nr:SurA N-terminal domain-containing protein [Magnetococcales bacterium]
MLNVLRRSANSIIIKILLVFLAISFGIWGIGDYAGRASVTPVATVGGHEISPVEFQHAYETFLNSLRQSSGGKLDKKTAEMLGMKQQVLLQMVHRILIQDAVRSLRLAISPERLRTLIATNPAFLSNGQFDEERYRAILHREHLNPSQYETNLASDLTLSQLEKSLSQIPGLPRVLQEDLLRMESEERAIHTLTLDPRDLEKEVPITPELLQSHHAAHQNRFMTPLQVKLAYVTLNAASVRDDIQVTDQEVETYYQDHLSEYQSEESRQVRHILARVSADNKESTRALEKIHQAKARIKGGDSFEEVARQLSEDATASEGGDLGLLTRGITQPVFDKVAFSLAAGEVSEPVRTDSGYHLLKVERIVPATTRALPDVAADIRHRLREEKVQDAIYARSVTMEDQLSAQVDLKTMAKDLRLGYQETGLLRRDDPKLQETEKSPKFQDSAFSLAQGGTSPLLEVNDGTYIVVKVVERHEPQAMKLDEAKMEVEKALRTEQANQNARKIMEDLLQGLRKGEKPWEQAGKSHAAISTGVFSPFTFGGKGEKPPAATLRRAAFQLTMEAPLYPTIVRDGPLYTLVRLTGIHHPVTKATDPQQQKITEAMRNELGEEVWDRFLAGLRQQNEIKVNPKVLDTF